MGIEQEIRRARARLLRLDRGAASEIARSYTEVRRRLETRMRALLSRIDEARLAGEDVKPVWLTQEERYQRLIEDLDQSTLRFLQRALASTTKAKRAAIKAAVKDAPDLTKAKMGPAPRGGEAAVRSTFSRLPDQALAQLVDFAGDGAPLARLFAEINPEAVQALKDALAFGVGSGQSIQGIARALRDAGAIPLSRATTIARTEVLRAYRTTSGTMYASSRIVDGWTWWAELDERTCPICWAEHGTFHPADEFQDTHINCRCTQVPETKSWADLGFDEMQGFEPPPVKTGEEIFGNLSATDRLTVLGKTRAAAYEAGEISLSDIPRTTFSPRWGGGLRQATLAELGLKQAA